MSDERVAPLDSMGPCMTLVINCNPTVSSSAAFTMATMHHHHPHHSISKNDDDDNDDDNDDNHHRNDDQTSAPLLTIANARIVNGSILHACVKCSVASIVDL